MPGDMQKFELTLQSGRKMPPVGLGTLAPDEGEEEVIKAVRVAIKAGYRHIDCAAIYRNERAVGSAIKSAIIEDTVRREDLFICSKLWNTCHRPDLVRTSLRKSLEDLGVQYLDLYLMHWPMAYKEGGEFHPWDENGKIIYSDVDYVDTWKALEDCVDEGLVRDIGMSNFNSKQLQRILDVARIKPSNNQLEINVHLSNEKLIEFCKSVGVTVTAFAPLGNLSVKRDHTPIIEEPVVLDIAKKKNKTAAQVALRYLIQKGVGVVPKSKTPSRIVENFQIFDFSLSDDEMKALAQLNRNIRVYDESIALEHKYYPFNEPF
ncbi:1,5-anhydro-D-fructose reductase-like [Liolophura sinensis]|uniref:1,5-anhydro-D-fructose reductase-like n=1 Tax=Liolophura sinensis TaxID=3198878 RepID=UPI003158194A